MGWKRFDTLALLRLSRSPVVTMTLRRVTKLMRAASAVLMVGLAGRLNAQKPERIRPIPLVLKFSQARAWRILLRRHEHRYVLKILLKQRVGPFFSHGEAFWRQEW